MEQKYTVDARGEQCPIPVVKTKKVLDGIQGDAEITVLVDNETAVQNLTRMGKHAGAEVLSEKKSDQEFQVIIRVKDQKQAETQEETVECIPDVKCWAWLPFLPMASKRLRITLKMHPVN